MILMNLGSRYVAADLSPGQQGILESEVFKQLITFCMFFVPTRDIKISAMLTFAFFFITKTILNENKVFSLLNKPFGDYETYKAHVLSRK
jgi:hypothetical protein